MADRPLDPAEVAEPTTGRQDLPLVALRETVIFPEMIVPLQVGREKSVNALNAAVAEGGPIALVTQRQAEQEEIDDPSELYTIGTLAKIAQVVQLQDGTVRAIVQGQSRLRVHGFTQTDPYLRASIEELPDVTPEGIEYHGGEAMSRSFRMLPLGAVAAVLDLPVIRYARDLAYAFFTRARPFLSRFIHP